LEEFFLEELLRNGTTTAAVYCTVHPESVDAFFTASHRRNTRMIAGKVMMDRGAPAPLLDTAERGYRESEALIGRWHGRGRQHYAQAIGVCHSILAVAPNDPATLAMLEALESQKRRADLPEASRARGPSSTKHARVMVAIALCSIAGVALARQTAPWGMPWILAGVLTVLACALVPLTRSKGLLVAAAAAGAAALPTLLMQQSASMWMMQVPCVVHEVATAAVAVAALFIWHQDRGSRSPSSAAGVAALGALAGDASLHVACPSASSFAHVLVFHVGGIVVAAVIAGLVAARMLAPRGALS